MSAVKSSRPARKAGGCLIVLCALFACGGEPATFSFVAVEDECKSHCIARVEVSLQGKTPVSAACGAPIELSLDRIDVGATTIVIVEALDASGRVRLSDRVEVTAPASGSAVDATVRLQSPAPPDIATVTPGPELVVYSSTVVTIEGANFGFDASDVAVWLRPRGGDTEVIDASWPRLDVESWSQSRLTVRVPEQSSGNAFVVDVCGVSDAFDAAGKTDVRPLVFKDVSLATLGSPGCVDGTLVGAIGDIAEDSGIIGHFECPNDGMRSMFLRIIPSRDGGDVTNFERRPGVPRAFAARVPERAIVGAGDKALACNIDRTQMNALFARCDDVPGIDGQFEVRAASAASGGEIVVIDRGGQLQVYTSAGAADQAVLTPVPQGRTPVAADLDLLLSQSSTRADAHIERLDGRAFVPGARIEACVGSQLKLQRIWESPPNVMAGGRGAVVCGREVAVLDTRRGVTRIDFGARVDAVEFDATGTLLWVYSGESSEFAAYDVDSMTVIGSRQTGLHVSGKTVLVRAPLSNRMILGAPGGGRFTLVEH